MLIATTFHIRIYNVIEHVYTFLRLNFNFTRQTYFVEVDSCIYLVLEYSPQLLKFHPWPTSSLFPDIKITLSLYIGVV